MLCVNWQVSEASETLCSGVKLGIGDIIMGGQCKIGYMLYVCMDDTRGGVLFSPKNTAFQA